MAINPEVKKLLLGGAWASSETADKVDPEQDSPPLTREIGYPISFSQANGDVITREGANGRWNEIDSALIAALVYAAQPWDADVDWPEESIVQYKGILYCSSKATGPNEIGGAKTPGTDSEWGTLPGASSVPEAPTNLSFVRPEPNQLTLRWTPPKDGGEAITGYHVDRGGSSTTVAYPEITVSGLTNGSNHVFKVRAVNSKGNGPWSGSVTGTPVANKPGGGTEFSLQATASNAKVTLNWLEPAASGSSLTNYIIQWKSGNQNWSSGRSATISGNLSTYDVSSLTNGTSYDFQIKARSNIGDGNWSRQVSATPQSPPVTMAVPGELPDIQKTATNGGFIANIMPPKDNGAKITHFQVRHYKFESGPFVESSESTSSEIEMTGLTNGEKYTISGRAKNSVGWGPWSGASTPLVPTLEAPNAPIVGDESNYDWPNWPDLGIMSVSIALFPAETGGRPTHFDMQTHYSTSSTPPVAWNSSVRTHPVGYGISENVPSGGNYLHARFRYKNSAGHSGWSVFSSRYKTPGGILLDPREMVCETILSTTHLTTSNAVSTPFMFSPKSGTGLIITGIRARHGGDATSAEVRWVVRVGQTDHVSPWTVKKQAGNSSYTIHYAYTNQYPKSSTSYGVKIQARGVNVYGTGSWYDLYDFTTSNWTGFAGLPVDF